MLTREDILAITTKKIISADINNLFKTLEDVIVLDVSNRVPKENMEEYETELDKAWTTAMLQLQDKIKPYTMHLKDN